MDLITDYLARLDQPRPDRPDADALRRLHAAHLEHVPFENLSVALGEPIGLDIDALAEKIVTRRRGGFCYELNGLFAQLLRELGFDVTLLAARVWQGESYGPPFDHLAVRVRSADGAEWLADVGFGAHSRHPLRWQFDVDQPDPDGVFRLTAVDGDVVVTKDGTVQYRAETRARELADFAAMCWYQQHSPESHFTRNAICSRPTATGRVSLREDVLIVTGVDGRVETALPDDAAVLAAYRERFGIELDGVPRIESR